MFMVVVMVVMMVMLVVMVEVIGSGVDDGSGGDKK